MTLVAGISVGGMPAFVGDLLISRRVPAPVDLPTLAEVKVAPGLDSHFAVGLAQKLVIVRPYLLIAWAGSRANADGIMRALDRILPEQAADFAHGEEMLEILNGCAEDSEMVALLIHGGSVHPLGVRTRGFPVDGKRVYLLGSGGPDFFDYLETHPELVPGDESADGFLARAITLRFGARAMATQWISGTGLGQSWGGGFEVAYPEPDGFKKCDRLLFRAWKIDATGAYENSGRSFFTRYYRGDLFLSCFNPEEKTYVIRAPTGEPGVPPDYERIHPAWTVDLFAHEPSGSLIEFARFHPDHRPVEDFVELVNGQLAGWSMDQSHVEECVRTAIAKAGRGTSYEARRY